MKKENKTTAQGQGPKDPNPKRGQDAGTSGSEIETPAGTEDEDNEQSPDDVPGNETLEEPGVHREDLNEEPKPVNPTEENSSTLDLEPQANLTEEDIEALGPEELSMDGGDDELLKHRVYPVDFTGEDLDVPGSELDDLSESIGSEDEENNIYSVGGDRSDNLEDTNPDVVK